MSYSISNFWGSASTDVLDHAAADMPVNAPSVAQAAFAWRWLTVMLQRVFPAHFGERRTISETYWNSRSIM
jgi:hypothetical protein